jgi:hypothetical protein
VCELLDLYDVPASSLENGMSDIPAVPRRSPDRSWVAVLVLIALFLVALALTLVAGYSVNRRNQPSDEELTANFLSHESKFDELVEMLDSDRRSLRLGARESIDLAELSAVLVSAARRDAYKGLLQQISVADLRYFPGSGKVILLPAAGQTNIEGSSKSYVYMMGGQPQPVIAHHGYYYRGPGVYFVTGDRQIKGPWFIHYDTMIALAFSPY